MSRLLLLLPLLALGCRHDKGEGSSGGISEGDPGDSLFILTTGAVKAFLKNPGGGQRLVRTMTDGAFFGEISILSGKPRTATVTAATPCELLELDRPTLDGITKAHPRVQQVLEDFYVERATTQ